ncbi:SRPBCC family protein [Pelagovum pacificum]|uniref:SRPBCC family protein n=1 Tax=Pelagovum pacificum TaxID=2588711 RepID=A0A5C5GHH5_9RHOB|nr:SRPBCC family protein [Pelagovum pacificum]QQA42696.1 SRPBCC family protein [Pelagovum pacificum]TNY34153.1 SRPBCC family protein [Pelagovum pacificum]
MAHVYVSDVIDAPAEKVWAFTRDYNGHGDWHPIIEKSEIEEGRPSDQVGCVRAFTVSDGGFLRERLIAFSDTDRTFTYTILESPMPIENYVATWRVTPITEGDRSFVEWWADFDVSPEDEADIRERVGRNTFAAGIRAIADRVG